jgi:hypothetical protein
MTALLCMANISLHWSSECPQLLPLCPRPAASWVTTKNLASFHLQVLTVALNAPVCLRVTFNANQDHMLPCSSQRKEKTIFCREIQNHSLHSHWVILSMDPSQWPHQQHVQLCLAHYAWPLALGMEVTMTRATQEGTETSRKRECS